MSKLREGGANQQTSGKKVIQVRGANNNITHSMNDDERSEFTAHINSVLAGDLHIGDRIPIPTHTMQVFDECRGNVTRLFRRLRSIFFSSCPKGGNFFCGRLPGTYGNDSRSVTRLDLSRGIGQAKVSSF